MRSKFTVALVGAVAGLAASTAAFGLPWDIDMADAQMVRAYERPMKAPAPGTVAQPHIYSPMRHAPNFARESAEGQALTSPLPNDAATLALGKKMYGTYCTPCHGDGQTLGPVAQPGRFPGVIALSGPAGAAKTRTDGYIYLTIRNGGAVMPSYGWSMTDDEMWSIVHHVRTLPNAKYVPPAPPEES